MRNRSRNLWLVGALGASALGLMLTAGSHPLRAAEGEKPDAGLPADLARVPQNALMLASVNVGQLWDHEAIQKVRKDMAREVATLDGELKKHLGVSVEEIERFSWVATLPQGREPFLFFFRTKKPYDARKVRALLGGSQKEVKVGKDTYLVGERGMALLPLDGRTFVVGQEPEVRWLLETPAARKPGPLADAVHAAGKHTGVLALNPNAVPPDLKANVPAEVTPFLPLFDAEAGLVTADVGERVTVSLRITFDAEKKAQEAAKPLQALVGLMGLGLGGAIEQLEKGPEETKSLVAQFKQAQAALGEVKVMRKGQALEAHTSVKADLSALAPALAATVRQTRTAAARMHSANNLKQMGIAMHNYHDVHGAFPPPAVYDRDGKPTLSWRVLLLPYMGEDDLYKQFKLNEPWDSPHNKKLLDKMPAVFASPAGQGVKEHTTYYQALVGKGTIWDGKRGVRIQDVLDGTSNTIMIVEGGKPVPWTKPADLPFDPAKKVPKLGGLYPKGFNAAFCDGSVRFLAETVKDATLRLLILRADGMVIPDDF